MKKVKIAVFVIAVLSWVAFLISAFIFWNYWLSAFTLISSIMLSLLFVLTTSTAEKMVSPTLKVQHIDEDRQIIEEVKFNDTWNVCVQIAEKNEWQRIVDEMKRDNKNV